MKPWKRLARRVIHRDQWISLCGDTCQLSSGVVLEPYYVLEERHWVHAVAVDESGRFLLVRQYRYAADVFCREFPGGIVDAGEEPLVAARRELLEETGYETEEWTALPPVYANPARQTNRVYAFVAKKLRRVAPQSLDLAEEIECEFATRAEVDRRIRSGDFTQSTHIATFYLAQAALHPRIADADEP